MCISIGAALGAVLSIAQAAVSFQAAQEDYENRAEQWRQNYTNSLAASRDEQSQLGLRMIQEQESFAQRRHQSNIESAQIKAEAEVSAASSGVAGLSLDNIRAGITREVVAKEEADRTNYQNVVAQLGEETKATNTRAQNRINSVQRPRAPNPLGFLLQGIGGALKGFG